MRLRKLYLYSTHILIGTFKLGQSVSYFIVFKASDFLKFLSNFFNSLLVAIKQQLVLLLHPVVWRQYEGQEELSKTRKSHDREKKQLG